MRTLNSCNVHIQRKDLNTGLSEESPDAGKCNTSFVKKCVESKVLKLILTNFRIVRLFPVIPSYSSFQEFSNAASCHRYYFKLNASIKFELFHYCVFLFLSVKEALMSSGIS